MTTEAPTVKQLRWRRNKAAERARKAPPPPPAPSADFIERAKEEANARVRAAVMPEMMTVISQIGEMLREEGEPFSAEEMFSIWYSFAHDPRRPNLDIWRMSDSARNFTIDVWVARTIIEHQYGPGEATAGKIAKQLTKQGLGGEYTKGSLRVVVTHPQFTDGGAWPRRLEPRTSLTAYFDPRELAGTGTRLGKAYARTACREMKRGSSPALRQLRSLLPEH